MAFTDRFIKVPIESYSQKDKELLGKEEYFDNWEKFNPLDLSSYYPSTADDFLGTQISLKNGQSIWAKISPQGFELILNEHAK